MVAGHGMSAGGYLTVGLVRAAGFGGGLVGDGVRHLTEAVMMGRGIGGALDEDGCGISTGDYGDGW